MLVNWEKYSKIMLQHWEKHEKAVAGLNYSSDEDEETLIPQAADGEIGKEYLMELEKNEFEKKRREEEIASLEVLEMFRKEDEIARRQMTEDKHNSYIMKDEQLAREIQLKDNIPNLINLNEADSNITTQLTNDLPNTVISKIPTDILDINTSIHLPVIVPNNDLITTKLAKQDAQIVGVSDDKFSKLKCQEATLDRWLKKSESLHLSDENKHQQDTGSILTEKYNTQKNSPISMDINNVSDTSVLIVDNEDGHNMLANTSDIFLIHENNHFSSQLPELISQPQFVQTSAISCSNPMPITFISNLPLDGNHETKIKIKSSIHDKKNLKFTQENRHSKTTNFKKIIKSDDLVGIEPSHDLFGTKTQLCNYNLPVNRNRNSSKLCHEKQLNFAEDLIKTDTSYYHLTNCSPFLESDEKFELDDSTSSIKSDSIFCYSSDYETVDTSSIKINSFSVPGNKSKMMKTSSKFSKKKWKTLTVSESNIENVTNGNRSILKAVRKIERIKSKN